jgi:hypothetical protein
MTTTTTTSTNIGTNSYGKVEQWFISASLSKNDLAFLFQGFHINLKPIMFVDPTKLTLYQRLIWVLSWDIELEPIIVAHFVVTMAMFAWCPLKEHIVSEIFCLHLL